MVTKPAHEIAPGSFVRAEIDGRRLLCLKVERIGKEHTNHYLVPVEPLDDRRQLSLIYIDPHDELVPVDGITFAFADGAEQTPPEVGDMFANPHGSMLKVIDDPRSQRMFAYVDVATGQVRPRMERDIHHLLDWSVSRL